jgi:hypothetical protein
MSIERREGDLGFRLEKSTGIIKKGRVEIEDLDSG